MVVMIIMKVMVVIVVVVITVVVVVWCGAVAAAAAADDDDDLTDCRQTVVHQSTTTTSCFSRALFVVTHKHLSREFKAKVYISVVISATVQCLLSVQLLIIKVVSLLVIPISWGLATLYTGLELY